MSAPTTRYNLVLGWAVTMTCLWLMTIGIAPYYSGENSVGDEKTLQNKFRMLENNDNQTFQLLNSLKEEVIEIKEGKKQNYRASPSRSQHLFQSQPSSEEVGELEKQDSREDSTTEIVRTTAQSLGLIESCWSHEYKGYTLKSSIENNDLQYIEKQIVGNYNTLQEAKTFCELVQKQCLGIIRVLVEYHGSYTYRYLTQKDNTLILAPNISTWLKTRCREHNSILPSSNVIGLHSSSVPDGFFNIDFSCETSEAREAKKNASMIRRIWIWGERNSGTNYVQTLFKKNFNVGTTPGLPWKHGWIHRMNLAKMNNILNILVVKDVYAWLLSMAKHPHHNEYLLDLPIQAFLLSRWESTLWLRTGKYTEALENVFQLRASKLLSWKTVAPCLPYTYVIRYEDFNTNPAAVIRDIANKFASVGLKLMKDPIDTEACVFSRARCQDDDNAAEKKKYYQERLYLKDFNKETLKLIEKNLDYKIENLFGYNYTYVKEYIELLPDTSASGEVLGDLSMENEEDSSEEEGSDGCEHWSDIEFTSGHPPMLRAPQALWENCCKWCKSVKGCQAWTWNRGVCYLHKEKGEQTSRQGAISGLPS